MSSTDQIKEALKTAIQMERDGHDFYRKAASQTSSEMGEKVFNSLAEDEIVHLNTFQKIFEENIGKQEWDALVNSSNKYANLPVFPKDLKGDGGADTNELDALNMAMKAESEAIEFYTKMLGGIEDEDVRKIISEIIEQEKSHYLILEEEFNHLSNTGYWYDLDYLGG